MKHIKRSQSGFTLVEIAIVLVIIGLLLGGVLKGQAMIENAKIKQVRNDFNGTMAAYYAYRDRYNATPGDDLNATPALRGWTGSAAGDGSGIVGAPNAWTACAAGTGGEQCLFWRHMRHAGLITGTVNNANPQHAYNSSIRVTNASGGATGASGGLNICMTQLPAIAAAAVDSAFDDGLPGTGTVRGIVDALGTTVPGTTAAAAGYVEPSIYTVCKLL